MKRLILTVAATIALNAAANNQEALGKIAGPDETAKDQALRQLLVAAGNGEIPVLAKQIEDRRTSDNAVFLLSAIGTPEAFAALHGALESADPRAKAGILSALARQGYRGAAESAAALVSEEEPVGSAALDYLALTACDKCCDTLLTLLESERSPSAADACLAAAERNPQRAAKLCAAVYGSTLPAHIRLAALAGLARADAANRVKWLNTALESPDITWRGAIANLVAEMPDAEMTAYLAVAPASDPGRQALSQALMRHNRPTASAYLRKIAADAKSVETRTSAIAALGRLGQNESDFRSLIAFLGDTAPQIAHAARLSLSANRGGPADKAILDSYCKANEGSPEQKPLLELLASRNVPGASARIVDTLKKSADPELRTIALMALREQAEPEQLKDIFGVLNSAADDAESEAARKALFTLSKKYPDESAQAIASVYAESAPVGRILLLQAAGISGSDKALELIEKSLKDGDAEVRDNALRTLAGWKSPAALDLLAAQSKDYPDEKLRILAQRGYISLCETIIEPYEKLISLNKISAIPLREQERKLLAQAVAPVADAKKMPAFKIHRIGTFRSEACSVADFNGDGKPDISATPYIYYAPDWKAVKFRELGGSVDEKGKGYYDNFFDLVLDINKDGKPDILCGCWFAQQNQWYENPGSDTVPWTEHVIEKLGNHETGKLEDIDGDGKALEFLPHTHITCWYEVGQTADGKPTMIRHTVSDKRNVLGAGAGDINGDGRPDIIRPDVWFEAPQDIRKGEWKAHPIELAKINGKVEHTSNIIVFDVNKDGLNDLLVTTAHKHGIFWYEQTRDADGGIGWKQHVIDDTWSQAHYLAFADIDNDGHKELITGKRFMAHNGGDPDAFGNLCIRCYSFVPGPNPVFSRHTITENAGISAGLNIETVDMDGDGDLDLVTTGKFGGPILLENLLK